MPELKLLPDPEADVPIRRVLNAIVPLNDGKIDCAVRIGAFGFGWTIMANNAVVRRPENGGPRPGARFGFRLANDPTEAGPSRHRTPFVDRAGPHKSEVATSSLHGWGWP